MYYTDLLSIMTCVFSLFDADFLCMIMRISIRVIIVYHSNYFIREILYILHRDILKIVYLLHNNYLNVSNKFFHRLLETSL